MSAPAAALRKRKPLPEEEEEEASAAKKTRRENKVRVACFHVLYEDASDTVAYVVREDRLPGGTTDLAVREIRLHNKRSRYLNGALATAEQLEEHKTEFHLGDFVSHYLPFHYLYKLNAGQCYKPAEEEELVLSMSAADCNWTIDM